MFNCINDPFDGSFSELNLGTQEISGSTDWEVAATKGIITRSGHVQFFVQYIQATVIVSQTLDTRNQPQIKDLQLELGNIQVILWINFSHLNLQI